MGTVNNQDMDNVISQRIQQLKKQKGITSAKLAEQCGVSRSMISQLEKGEALPSLQTLGRIASALDVSLSEFFDVNASGSNESEIIVRAGNHRCLMMPNQNIRYNILSPDMAKAMEFLLIEFPPGEIEKTFRHSGIEFFYMMEGELDMVIDGDRYHIVTGDSGCFNSSSAHHMENKSSRTAKVLIAAVAEKE